MVDFSLSFKSPVFTSSSVCNLFSRKCCSHISRPDLRDSSDTREKDTSVSIYLPATFEIGFSKESNSLHSLMNKRQSGLDWSYFKASPQLDVHTGNVNKYHHVLEKKQPLILWKCLTYKTCMRLERLEPSGLNACFTLEPAREVLEHNNAYAPRRNHYLIALGYKHHLFYNVATACLSLSERC